MEGLQTEQQADRPTGDLRVQRDPVVGGLPDQVEHALPVVGGHVVLDEGVGDRAVGLRRQAPHPAQLAVRGRQVLALDARRGQLEHPPTASGQHVAEREQLVLGGEGAGHGLAVERPVHDGARRGDAERPGVEALADDRGHGLDVVGGGGLVAGAALAHHVGAHRAVGDLGGHVDRLRDPVDRVEVLREALPGPVDAVGEGASRGCPRPPPSAR